MSRKKKSLPILEQVEILDAGSEGKTIARVNEMVLFVTNAVPGDVVDVQLTRKKSTFLEGYPVKIHKKSDQRTDAFCAYFGVCGGCKWQNVGYEHQLYYKQKQVKDNLVRIGHLDIPEMEPILGAPETSYYRNKLEFTFSDRKWLTDNEAGNTGELDMRGLGFHIPGRFDKIVDIDHCYLQAEPSNSIRNAVKKFTLENGYDFQNLKFHKGSLRNLMIRTTSTGETMVVVSFGRDEKELRLELLEFIKTSFPEITSLMYVINEKLNDSMADLDVLLHSGQDYITEEMEGLKFKIGPKSFYQTNSDQAYNLYKITREYAGLTGNEVVYDLYTGTGTIANFVAKKAAKVIGVEYIPEAIEDAKVNANLNGIENTVFFAGDMKDVLTADFIKEHGQPDVIITDPPRSGMHPDVVETILRAEPKRVVYVSCNPATQARDLQLMSHKYEIKRVRPVDMFPHTHHVENVVLLEIRN